MEIVNTSFSPDADTEILCYFSSNVTTNNGEHVNGLMWLRIGFEMDNCSARNTMLKYG